MDTLIWIFTALLAFVFAVAGGSKLFLGRQKFAQRAGASAGWTQSVSDSQFTIIGFVELIGALGLILPKISGIAEFLSPIAAVGLALTMYIAVGLHAVRKDKPEAMMVPSLLGTLCLVLVVFHTI